MHSNQRAGSPARMIAPQTKFISEKLASRANSAPHSSTTGINLSYVFPYRNRVELSHSDYFFIRPNPPPTFGGSVSVDLPHGHLRKSFHLSLTSGLTRKVRFSMLGGVS